MYFNQALCLREQPTLKFWQFWPEKWIRPELDRFEKEHDVKVVVERLTWADGLNKIITALAADQAPDVIEIGSTWVAGFTQGGGLKAIQPQDLTNVLNGWAPALYNKQYYAVPWTLSTGAIFYNKDLLAQSGINQFPSDWNQLFQASERISSLGDDVVRLWYENRVLFDMAKILTFCMVEWRTSFVGWSDKNRG